MYTETIQKLICVLINPLTGKYNNRTYELIIKTNKNNINTQILYFCEISHPEKIPTIPRISSGREPAVCENSTSRIGTVSTSVPANIVNTILPDEKISDLYLEIQIHVNVIRHIGKAIYDVPVG